METEQDLIQSVETASSSSDVSRSSAVTLSSDPAASPSTTGLSSGVVQQSCCANASGEFLQLLHMRTAAIVVL